MLHQQQQNIHARGECASSSSVQCQPAVILYQGARTPIEQQLQDIDMTRGSGQVVSLPLLTINSSQLGTSVKKQPYGCGVAGHCSPMEGLSLCAVNRS